MKVAFTKMHGCGNDFVVIDGRERKGMDWSGLGRKLLDRRFGIGGDQLLVILSSEKADAKMAIFEHNGRESEMCGNGIRCVARHLMEKAGKSSGAISIETIGGVKNIEYESNDRIRVDMGQPIFEKIWGKDISVQERNFRIYALSMGNPHAVMFVSELQDLEMVSTVGPILETHELFPNRSNIGFVYVRDRQNLDVRVWERGAGATAACGTGACAAGVVAILEGKGSDPIAIHFAGGTVEVSWKEGGSVYMTGPAASVFDGEVEL